MMPPKTLEQRRRYEARRKRTVLGLRLTPEDCTRLRIAAHNACMPVGDFVIGFLDLSAPKKMQESVDLKSLAQLAAVTASIRQFSDALHDIEHELQNINEALRLLFLRDQMGAIVRKEEIDALLQNIKQLIEHDIHVRLEHAEERSAQQLDAIGELVRRIWHPDA